MKPLYIILAANLALLASASAAPKDKKPAPQSQHAIKETKPEAGKVIPRDELPESIKAQTGKKEAKFPGIPSCAKGRMLTTTWPESVPQDKHPCKDSSELYLCVSFGKVSVRCER